MSEQKQMDNFWIHSGGSMCFSRKGKGENGMRMEKRKNESGRKTSGKKTGRRMGARYLLSALALTALVGGGCAGETKGEKGLTTTPPPSTASPTEEIPEESQNPQDSQKDKTSATREPSQTGTSQGEGEPLQGEGSPQQGEGEPSQGEDSTQPGTSQGQGGLPQGEDSPQPGTSLGNGEPPQGDNSPQAGTSGRKITAVFPMVTPLPQEAVAKIAGSIAPADYPAVDGSTATLPLSQALYCYATGEDADAAEKAIVHTKTTNSYYRLYNGEADLLIVYEPPKEIIDRMRTEKLLIKPIGLDALVFMANTGNPVMSLTKRQLVDIYSGKIKNWKEVGGNNQELLAFQRTKGSGSQTLMQKLVMGDVAMEDGANTLRFETMGGILEGMATQSNAANTLGYSVFYYANFMYSLPELRFMGVNGVMPSTQSIYDGSYPFVNAFYAVIRPDEPEDSNARRLFDWLTGQDGQQMVLDLGYVPVQMPAGGQIAEKEPQRAGGPELTPVKNLAPGEHFIFVQEEHAPTNNQYGDVWIYDENWNCTASFSSALCFTSGLTDERYIEIYRLTPSEEEKTDEGEMLYIYDLAKEEFVDFSKIASGHLEVLDSKRGYFKCYDGDGASVIDCNGNVLLDWVPYLEEDVMLTREGDSYSASYWPDDLDHNAGWIRKIYDLDFHLKAILYDEREDMPPEKERVDGVEYVDVKNGCILSREGDVLLTPELFLETFGNGTDTECVFAWERPDWELSETVRELHEISYAGETWYVDAKRNAYLKEGETKLTILDAEKAEDTYYTAYMEDGRKYFLPDGSPLMAKSFEEKPEYTEIGENGSYVLAKRSKQGYVVEMAVPEDDYHNVYQYESSKAKYTNITYLEPYVVALGGKLMDEVDENGESQKELVIYRQGRMEMFRAKEVHLSQIKNWKTNQYEDVWLVATSNGGEQTLTEEGRKREFYTYAVVIGGKVRFTIPVPGEEVYDACHGGYLQIDAGSYTYVYDYDGNQIIKAYNRVVTEE